VALAWIIDTRTISPAFGLPLAQVLVGLVGGRLEGQEPIEGDFGFRDAWREVVADDLGVELGQPLNQGEVGPGKRPGVPLFDGSLLTGLHCRLGRPSRGGREFDLPGRHLA
jgi:hypothetical protein